MFYQSVFASSLFCAVLCWGTGAKEKEAKRLIKLIKKEGPVIGVALDPLDVVVERIMSKL